MLTTRNIFISCFLLGGNVLLAVFLLAGHVDHEEHLYRQPGRVGHLSLRLHHAPHHGGPHHQVLDTWP